MILLLASRVVQVPVYDFSVPEVRAAWVDECIKMTSPAGGFDGCMVDRWTRTFVAPKGEFTPDAVAAWSAARDQATAALADKAKAAGIYLVGEGASQLRHCFGPLHLLRVSRLCATHHAPCGMLNLVPMLTGC